MHRYPLRKALRLPKAALKRLVTGLLQLVLLANRPARLARSGFVLPTTVLLVLLLTLTAAALTYRATSRSTQVIAQREQQVITNAATPAIDRAKAKLEYLFQRDDRIPGGLPSSNVLEAMIIAPGIDLDGNGNGNINFGVVSRGVDVYTLPDETRLDINGDGRDDNAWMFRSDINGDGAVDDDEVVAYSILSRAEGTVPNTTTARTVTDAPDFNKAKALVTRTGPISSAELSQKCRTARAPEAGWQIVNASRDLLQKNFQVDAFVVNRGAGADLNRTVQTLEFQQSREAARGSKWGAWFRYDLEVFPGPEFKWNGAMHSDSNIFVHDNFKAYMVSSNYSCIYSETASEITLDSIAANANQGIAAYEGEFVVGAVKNNNLNKGGANPEVHIYNGGAAALSGTNGLRITDNNPGNDSIRAVSGQTVSPSHVGANPITLFTEGRAEHTVTTSWQRDPNWAGSIGARRILNKQERKPFVDDFFRADNRWGPKPAYKNFNMRTLNASDSGVSIGKSITATTYPGLIDGEGLDGFWEREAIRHGLRLIVGQRLELGNMFGWNVNPRTGAVAANQDPLYPPTTALGSTAAMPTDASLRTYQGGVNEVLQRRALRDNLAAAQSMAVYHYQDFSGDFPRACVALTAHPGTPSTIVNSRTFSYYPGLAAASPAVNRVKTDFFSGNGTNGWEFTYPASFDSPSEFSTEIGTARPLGIALRNLAHFAGDPLGGAPSFEPVQDTDVHPFPQLSMWGDFSALRRVLALVDGGTSYGALSPADKTTLHTAACTLGMLAYNIKNEVDEYRALDNATFPSSLQSVTQRVGNLIGDIISYMGGSNLTGSNGTSIMSTLTARGLDRAGWLAKCPTYTSTLFSAYSSTATPAACGLENYFASFTLNDWIALIPFAPGNIPASAIPDLQAVATRVNYIDRLIRDRDLGFRQGTAVTPLAGSFTSRVAWDSSTGVTAAVTPQGGAAYRFRTLCDPNIFRTVGAAGAGGDGNVVVAGLIACSDRNVEQVRFPSLYYLFPIVDHDHDGTGYHTQPGNSDAADAANRRVGQADEEYITNAYVRTKNASYTYKVVGSSALEGINDIALVPGAPTLGWNIPAVGGQAVLTTAPFMEGATAASVADATFRINLPTAAGGTPAGANVAFLDKGMYDGREQMAIRVLDLDIKTLSSTRTASGRDYWIPDNRELNAEGVVFAYREDAVREDEIVRPKNASATVATCTGVTAATSPSRPRFALETNADCRMVAIGGTRQDPPLTQIGISLKPVDYAPDPERRPFGFRFRNGADVSNGRARSSGLTFVTDNAVYVQGDFNLHSTNGQVAAANGSNLIEEFTSPGKLRDIADWGPGDFYGTATTGRREALLNTDTQFSVLTFDHWRPVEILADSIGILSNSFNDGTIAHTFVEPTSGDAGGAKFSYQNQNRPWYSSDVSTLRRASNWVQENEWQGGPYTALVPDSTNLQNRFPITPIWVSRDGEYQRVTPSATPIFGGHGEYIPLGNPGQHLRNLITASPTTINASFVSGIIPSRAFQSYGGFHNFPRFNEYWKDKDLYISGSFFQLDFSTAATGPFDQDAWEPGQDPNSAGTNENIYYYDPPNRRWGYDVALQYVPPAPVSRRFVTYGSPRSEYYRELSTDDPYMVLLRCAPMPGGNGTRLDPRVDTTQCPA